MKIPYGIADFEKLREGNYLYIDKTRYIETLEEMGDYLFFIRPRRFGKSLFISTLKYYYDLNQKNNFDKLFSGLYISAEPTKLKNSYFILSFNFSGLNTDSKDKLEDSFSKIVESYLIDFVKKYESYFNGVDEVVNDLKSETDLNRMLRYVYSLVHETDRKIYVMIDEYDHFANDILAIGDNSFYKDTIRARGFVRDFYETLKIGTESIIDRIFMTGISPIMLDDLTSGFNIMENLTIEEELNEVLGFTSRDVESIMKRLGITNEEIKIDLAEYYNGYLFNLFGKDRVYNPDMILYFLKKFQRTKRPPRKLIDDNVKTDYGRLQRLISNKKNRATLEKIILEERINENIVTRFSFDRMYDREYFVSLLFYMGLLTIDKEERFKLILKIPNYVIKTIYWDYIKKSLREEYQIEFDLPNLNESIAQLAFEGKVEPYIEYISQHILKQLSNRDLQNFDEKYIKVILFSYLTTTRAYKTYSEREVEDGYIDIFLEKDMRSPEVEYEWVWELKYLKKSDRDNLEKVKEKGLEKLEEYASSSKFADKKNLKKALIIFIGKDEYQIVRPD